MKTVELTNQELQDIEGGWIRDLYDKIIGPLEDWLLGDKNA